MNILIGCECSGITRKAFAYLGHQVTSVDLLETELECCLANESHIKGNIEDFIDGLDFDLGIFYPPCNHLAVSGARWFKEKIADGRQQAGIELFMTCVNADIPKICVENPVGIMSTKFRKPDQIIQPWMFGHGEVKKTCLWLKGLKKLEPTNIVEGREERVHKMSPGPNRAKDRGRTYPGTAMAMAWQWGGDL